MVWAAAGAVVVAGIGAYTASQANKNKGNTGLSGTTTGKDQTLTQDLNTQQLNAFRYNQLAQAGQQTNLASILNRQDYFSQPWGSTYDQLSQAIDYTGQQGLNPQDWYNQTRQGLDYQRQSDYLTQLYGNAAQAGGDYFQNIVSPQVSSQYSLMGLGRSGANEQAQQMAAYNIGMPISMANAQAQQGLQNQYLQNLYGLNQQYPNSDINLRQAQLGRYAQGIQYSDYPRLQMQIGNQNQAGSFLSALNSLPYNPSNTQTGSIRENSGLLSGFGGATGPALAGLAAAGMFDKKPTKSTSSLSTQYDPNYISNMSDYS